LADETALEPYPVEEIPGSATLFMRVAADIVARAPAGKVPPGAFRVRADPEGKRKPGVSVDWDKYADAQFTCKDPSRFSVAKMLAQDVRSVPNCELVHTPIRAATDDNRAHCDIYGPLRADTKRLKLEEETRVKLARCADWAELPRSGPATTT
jgi:hypothetical protein